MDPTNPADATDGEAHSQGHAELLSLLPPPTGDAQTTAAPAGPWPGPGPGPSAPPSGVSPALAGFAVVVVLATVALLAFALIGQRPHAPALPATDLASLWNAPGYQFAPGDPSLLQQIRAAISADSKVGPYFRDSQMRVVSRNGHVVALVLALGIDPKVIGGPGFAHGVFDGMRDSLNGTLTGVAGRPAIVASVGGVSEVATLKRDVMVFVAGPVRADLDPLLGALAAGIP